MLLIAQSEGKAVSEGLDEEVEESEVTLLSKDKKEFKILKTHAYISTLIKTSLENDSSATTCPVLGVDSKILEKVVEYMTFHKGKEAPIVEKPLRSKKMKDVCKDPWDAGKL